MPELQVQGKKIQCNELPQNVFAESVIEVQHYTDRLFRFTITRPPSFRFRSGEFVMIGLPNSDKPVYRAYSIASALWAEYIEFFSIKVPGGPLTEHLQKIQKGDTILLRKKSTGTLVHDALIPGKRLYLLSTGTGVAPFASIIRDFETYEKFEEIILVQTTRKKAEQAYIKDVINSIKSDELLAQCSYKLKFYPMTTREHSEYMGRITDSMRSGAFFKETGLPKIDPQTDRVMICGSMAMIKETAQLCTEFGLEEGANNAPASYVIERAFVG